MKFLNITLLATLSVLFITSCTDRKSIDEIREETKKNFPFRQDSWFGDKVANKKDLIDPYADLSREDYMDIINKRNNSIGSIQPSMQDPVIKTPKIDDLLAEPEKHDIVKDKLVSISVNEEVSVKDVLLELARKAEVDVEIDKEIDAEIIFIAKDRPFSEVIKRISRMANLRYKFDDGTLIIERDRPFVKSYVFNILDITRNSESSVTASFSVGSEGGEGGSTASIQSGSTSQLDTKSGDGDIWSDVEGSVSSILANYGGNEGDSSQILSLNRGSGVISVLANEKQHKEVKKVLDTLHLSITSQVLIEAKVLEVTLDDRYASGINWSLLADNVFTAANAGGAAATTGLGIKPTNAQINLPDGSEDIFKFSVLPTSLFGNDSTSLEASVELLENFGVTRSLSNPRISTMNNQYAVLNFTENDVYFEVTLEEEEEETASGQDQNVKVESEIRTVPIGVVLGLQPSIDLQRKEITMSIRPTLTRSSTKVDDPGVSIIADRLGINTDTLNSQIPIVEVRELDTVLRVESGEIVMIGGLLEERAINNDIGVPGMAKIPYVGNMFKSVDKQTEMVETVIFLKASIVPGRGVSVKDEEFYKKFGTGRHSFFVD